MNYIISTRTKLKAINVVRTGGLVLSMRILVGMLRKAHVNVSNCAMSAGAVFENCVLQVLLWRTFQTAVKIAYNLSIIVLHQIIFYSDGTDFHCFILCLCTQSLWLENSGNVQVFLYMKSNLKDNWEHQYFLLKFSSFTW